MSHDPQFRERQFNFSCNESFLHDPPFTQVLIHEPDPWAVEDSGVFMQCSSPFIEEDGVRLLPSPLPPNNMSNLTQNLRREPCRVLGTST